jgi:single-strand DNA-binding protein
MAGVNKVILIGNLGRDPEVRDLESGAKVATFSVATTESYRDRTTNERKDQTEWHNIVLWRGLAEIAQKYLKKGSKVYIEGKLTSRQYQDKEGNNRYIAEVVGRELTMLDSAGSRGPGMPSEEYGGGGIPESRGISSGGNSSASQQQQQPAAANNFDDAGDTDDLPF